MQTSKHFALIHTLQPLGCEQGKVSLKTARTKCPVTMQAGKPSWNREDRKPRGPAVHTCSVVLLHTHVKFLLRELGCKIVHIADPDVENQGFIYNLSC